MGLHGRPQKAAGGNAASRTRRRGWAQGSHAARRLCLCIRLRSRRSYSHGHASGRRSPLATLASSGEAEVQRMNSLRPSVRSFTETVDGKSKRTCRHRIAMRMHPIGSESEQQQQLLLLQIGTSAQGVTTGLECESSAVHACELASTRAHSAAPTNVIHQPRVFGAWSRAHHASAEVSKSHRNSCCDWILN